MNYHTGHDETSEGVAMFYSAQKIAQMFSPPHGAPLHADELLHRSAGGELPPVVKGRGGLGWRENEVVNVGQALSSIPRFDQSKVITVFVTKGGVLKTTLTLNLARQMALNGFKTLVIGLDLQGDVTSALGHQTLHEHETLQAALKELDETQGLYDYFSGQVGLEDLIQKTDLPTLDLIPETPELIALDQELLLKPRREFWLKEKVTRPLSQIYDLILIDCSPNWNQLITNALVATDLLLSPVECRINNFRNLKMFQALIHQCRQDLALDFHQAFVPTRLNSNRKLSREIGEWYHAHLTHCLTTNIRESLQGEEASALHLSIPEFSPESPAALEIKVLLWQISQLLSPSRQSSSLDIQKSESSSWPSV